MTPPETTAHYRHAADVAAYALIGGGTNDTAAPAAHYDGLLAYRSMKFSELVSTTN